jgi:HD-GYP domain-containing protein (c-di-GMP phosphodiesterase class II)
LRKLDTTKLQPGMVLARSIINEQMIVILSENTLLTKAHITRLSFLDIPEVYIKDEYELSNNYQNVEAMLNRSNAFVVEYEEIVSTAREIFYASTKTEDIPVEKIEKLVDRSIAPVVQNSGVLDYLYELNHLATDVYQHCVRVSILSGVLGKWMNLKKSQIKELIVAGFLHDIGKTLLDQNILDKRRENLTDEEYDLYMQHTLNGHHLIAHKDELSDGIKLAVLQHHERLDGSGFPFNAQADDIHLYARIVAIADIYDNITTEREGRRKETPFTAIAQITKEMFTSLDPSACVPFLTNIHQVFIGSTVILSDRRRGRIMQYPLDFAALPLIEIDPETIINLNNEKDLSIVEYNPKQ